MSCSVLLSLSMFLGTKNNAVTDLIPLNSVNSFVSLIADLVSLSCSSGLN